jgi:hypothetical protein
MRESPVKKTIAGLSVLLLSLTACGGGLSSDDKSAIAALSDSIRDDSDQSAAFTSDKAEADCIAEGMVTGIGVDQLVEYEILTEDFKANDTLEQTKMSEGDAGIAADVVLDCMDVRAMMMDQMGVSELPAEVLTCLEGALSDDIIKSMMVASFTGAEDATADEVSAAIMSCVTSG